MIHECRCRVACWEHDVYFLSTRVVQLVQVGEILTCNSERIVFSLIGVHLLNSSLLDGLLVPRLMFLSSTRSSCSVWSSQVDLIRFMERLRTHNIRNSNGNLSASDGLDHVSWRPRRPATEAEAVLCRCRGELMILIIIIIIIIICENHVQRQGESVRATNLHEQLLHRRQLPLHLSSPCRGTDKVIRHQTHK